MSEKTRKPIIVLLILVAVAGAAAFLFRGQLNKIFGERPVIIKIMGAPTVPFSVDAPKFRFQGNPNQLGAPNQELHSLELTDITGTVSYGSSRLTADCVTTLVLSMGPAQPNPSITVTGVPSSEVTMTFGGIKPGTGDDCRDCTVKKVTCLCCGPPLKDFDVPANKPVVVWIKGK